MSIPEQVEIDFLMVADRAEAVNGKLYIMGGAWDRLGVNDFSKPVSISLAIGVLVPWNWTNEPQTLSIQVQNADAEAVKPGIQAEFNVGRPPHATKGQVFRALLAVTSQWVLPGPGEYQVVASLSGAGSKTTAFYAVSAEQPQLPKQK